LRKHKSLTSKADAENKPRQKKPLRGSRGVYKRGDVWLAVVEGPKDPKTGRRRRVWIREQFRTRKAAEEARDRMRDHIRGGIGIKPEKLSVSDVVTRYIDHRVALGKLGEKAAERYRQLARLNIKPQIGSIRIRSLHKSHVTGLVSYLLADGRQAKNAGRTKKRTGLSPTTVSHAFSLLKSALAWAVSVDIVARNVADIEETPQRARSEADSFTDKEIVALLDSARGTRWEPMVTFVLATGIRRGEAAALRRECVVIDALGARGVVTIKASFSQTKDGNVLKGTKTGRARQIPLTGTPIAALGRQGMIRAQDEFAAETMYEDQGFVFADPLGAPYSPYALTDAFRNLAKKAGVRKRLHDLRHTALSNLLADGIDVVTVASIAGHSSVQTTLNTYAHQLLGMKEQAMDKLDARLKAAIERGKKSE
jgi:integrase